MGRQGLPTSCHASTCLSQWPAAHIQTRQLSSATSHHSFRSQLLLIISLVQSHHNCATARGVAGRGGAGRGQASSCRVRPANAFVFFWSSLDAHVDMCKLFHILEACKLAISEVPCASGQVTAAAYSVFVIKIDKRRKKFTKFDIFSSCE